MRTRIGSIVSAVALLCVSGPDAGGDVGRGAESAGTAEGAGTETLFVLHYSTGPAWIQDRPFLDQSYAAEHSRNLSRLRDEGMILVGARYADRGMLVLRAVDEAVVREQIEMDPMVAESVFVYDVYPLSVFYEGCVERPELD